MTDNIVAGSPGFSSGLFSGMNSYLDAAAKVQENTIRQSNIDAANSFAKAKDGTQQTQPDTSTPVDQTVNSTPDTPDPTAGSDPNKPLSDLTKLPGSKAAPTGIPVTPPADHDKGGLMTPPPPATPVGAMGSFQPVPQGSAADNAQPIQPQGIPTANPNGASGSFVPVQTASAAQPQEPTPATAGGPPATPAPQQGAGGPPQPQEPTTGALPPSGPAGGGGVAQAAPAQPSIGSRMLSALSPISSAQAAPAQPASPAEVAAIKNTTPVPQGALSPSMQDVTPGREQPPEVQAALQRAQAGQSPTQGGAGQPPPPAAPRTAATPPDAPAATPAPNPATPAQAAQRNIQAADAPVAPNQKGPSQDSDAPTTYVRPPFDPRPYAGLAQDAPGARALVDKVAAEEGVNPMRLALHWNLESGLKPTSPDGTSGERGVMQMMPATQKMIDPNMTLNPAKLEDSLRMGARYINYLDAHFGQDTPTSIVSYQGGPGAGMAFAANPDKARQTNPTGAKYLDKAMMGQTLTSANFQPPLQQDGMKLIQASLQGPDKFIHYLAQSGPAGVPMGDLWRGAETSMMKAAIMHGDYEGASKARDMVAMMAQQGNTTSLMGAYKALQNGDGVSAAQLMARAHSFFPDGSMGKFGVDASGNVWAQRVDEHDPTRSLGAPFQMDTTKLMSMMTVSQDPNKFIAMMQQQQKSAADIRYTDAHGQYFGNVLQNREELATDRGNVALSNAQTRAQAQVDAANARANAAQRTSADRNTSQQQIAAARIAAQQETNTHIDNVHKELATGGTGNNAGGPIYNDISDVQARGAAETLHADLRYGDRAMPSAQAEDLSRGVIGGRYGLRQTQTGTYAITTPQGTPIGVVSHNTGVRITSMIGNAASTKPPTVSGGALGYNSSAVPRQNAPSTQALQ